MKNWNWSAFFVTLVVCLLGAVSNNKLSLLEALGFGLTFGTIFGLIWAYVSRK